MGIGPSLGLHSAKAKAERGLHDEKRSLARAMSKANSLEALNKAVIADIKGNIKKSESMLSLYAHLLAAQDAEEGFAGRGATEDRQQGRGH